MHNTVIPNGEPENVNEESREHDLDSEGLDNSEDIETSVTKDGGLPAVNEVGPSDPSLKTKNTCNLPRRELPTFGL